MRAGRTLKKGIWLQVRQPGELDVAARRSDLLNHRRARSRRLRHRGEIAILDDDRDMREGGDLSRGEIAETSRLKLDDAFNHASISRRPGEAARSGLKRGPGRERRRFGMTHQDRAAQFSRKLGHLGGRIIEARRVSRRWAPDRVAFKSGMTML